MWYNMVLRIGDGTKGRASKRGMEKLHIEEIYDLCFSSYY
jgi:hypothetical protein